MLQYMGFNLVYIVVVVYVYVFGRIMLIYYYIFFIDKEVPRRRNYCVPCHKRCELLFEL